MNDATENGLGSPGKDDTGEVPEKQLHRWKGEGGALPPEPVPEESKSDSDEGPPARGK
jgi:hypothetical protein